MSLPVVLYGASELGRDAVSVFPALEAAGTPREFLGFVDDDPAKAGRVVLGYPVLGPRHWLSGRERAVEVLLGIGEPRIRKSLASSLTNAGHRFATLVHPSVQSTPWVSMGEGTLVMAGCTLTVEVRLGRHVVLNPRCSVAHDVIVGDFSYLSPGVNLAGAAIIEDGVHLGTGATVLPHRRVGRGAVVGAGAVVTRDVPPGEVFVGVPARRLRSVHQPWEAE